MRIDGEMFLTKLFFLTLKGLCRGRLSSNQTNALNKRVEFFFRALAVAFAQLALNAVEVLPPCVPLGITAWQER